MKSHYKFRALLFPVFARARVHARQAACTSNLKQIGWDDARLAAELAAYEAIARDRLP